MEDIRCDLLSDDFMSFEAEGGYLKVNIHNNGTDYEETVSSIYLSKESTAILIKGLTEQLEYIPKIEKSPL